MYTRAIICCLLMIGQPLVAFASAVQTFAGDEVSATHCESMSVTDHANTMPEHGDADCFDSCDQCASCAMAFGVAVLPGHSHSRSANSLMPSIVMPPGETELLYRPPILS
jgi:hypothetical protein